MGFDIAWIAFKDIPEDLLLNITKEIQNDVQYFVADNKRSLILGDLDTFQNFDFQKASINNDFYYCFAHEGIMCSGCSYWKDSNEVWGVLHDSQSGGIDHLITGGDVPEQTQSLIKDASKKLKLRKKNIEKSSKRISKESISDIDQEVLDLISKTGGIVTDYSPETSLIDYHFDIPINLMNNLVGFRYDTVNNNWSESTLPEDVNSPTNKKNSISELKKSCKALLKKKGFKQFSQDGNSIYCYMELSKNRLDYSLHLPRTLKTKSISAESSYISNIIGDAVNYIDQRRHTVFPGYSDSCPCTNEWGNQSITLNNIENFVDISSNEAIDYCKNGDFTSRTNEILSTIDIPGSHQLWHLAALAATNQTKRLQEILIEIDHENRGGFFPYITHDYINRAIEFSENNTKK